MKTIIVPVDFSPTSQNAAHYAIQMLNEEKSAKIILYHVYDDEDYLLQSRQLLLQLKSFLQQENNSVTIDCVAEHGYDFIESLSKYARHNAAEAIVMGITDRNKFHQMLMGSKTLKAVQQNICPVLIVPPTAKFSQIKNVAFLCDFKNVKSTIPVVPLKKVLNMLNPSLHVVNINSEHYVSVTEEYTEGKQYLKQAFEEFNPEFYFIGTFNFQDTVNQFVKDKQIDLLLTIPKSHSFIDHLFKVTHTKKMAFESPVPVLAAHE